MFERFTERARQVVVFAQEEARRFGHDDIGTEHILLGLLREEQGLGARVLRSYGITDECVDTRLGEIPWVGQRVVHGSIPFTPHAKNALELASVEADALDRDTTATHHLLLGLLQVTDGGAVRLLLHFGAEPSQLREQLLANLSTAPEEWPTSMQELADYLNDTSTRIARARVSDNPTAGSRPPLAPAPGTDRPVKEG